MWFSLILYAGLAASLIFAWSSYTNGLIEKGEARAGTEWQLRWNQREERWTKAAIAEKARWEGERERITAEATVKLATLTRELEAAKRARSNAEKELIAKRRDYVTALGNSRCIIPLGFVLYHDRAAATANGQSSAASSPPPGPELADSSSGSDLDAVAATVERNLAALGECRDQVIGWQKHWQIIEAWYADLVKASASQPSERKDIQP